MHSLIFSGSLLSAASGPAAGAGRALVDGRAGNGRGFPLRELVRRHGFLELEVLPVAADEHRRRVGDRRGVEVVVVLDRRDALRRRAAVDEVLVEASAFSILSRFSPSPKIGLPLSSVSLPPCAQNCASQSKVVPSQRPPLKSTPSLPFDAASSAAAFSSAQSCGAFAHDVLVAIEQAKVGVPPPRVDVAVRPGDAGLDEGEEVVDLFLAEELRDRRKRALLDEERELEGVDRGAVRRAAGARLLEHAGVLAADVRGEVFEVDLPVGMGSARTW